MSDYFEEFTYYILDFERGFVNHPNDGGGPTNYGMSLRFMQSTEDYQLFDLNNDGVIDIEDVKLLTVDVVKKAFRKYFWDLLELDNFHPRVALILYDMIINHNLSDVVEMLQKSINRVNSNNVVVDGIFGSNTKKAILNSNSMLLSEQLLSYREQFYFEIVENNQSQSVFLNGWLNKRIDHLRKISLRYCFL